MDKTLAGFAKSIERWPDSLAIFDENRRLTHKQLANAVNWYAQTLMTRGAKPGQLVGWLGPIGLDFVIYLLATQKAGLVAFAPNLDNTDEVLSACLSATAVTQLVVHSDFVSRAAKLGWVEIVVSPRVAPETAPFKQIKIDPSHLCCVAHTSGSTGMPKLIGHRRSSQSYFTNNLMDVSGIQRDDVQCLVGHFWPAVIFGAIESGASIGCFDASKFGATALTQWMKDEAVTMLMTYPALYRQVAATGSVMESLRCILLAGEPLHIDDINAFEKITSGKVRLANTFGSMEFQMFAAYVHQRGDPVSNTTLPIGQPLQPRLVFLRNDTGVEARVGEIGEIEVRSRHVPNGYFNSPHLTDTPFRELADGHRAFRTGDFAYRDHLGQLHSMGRRDQQVKIRGYNVRLNNIESAIETHENIRAVAVVVIQSPGQIRRLACHFTGDISPDQLRLSLSSKLPNYMLPTIWRRHEALPITSSGKIKRTALAELGAEVAMQSKKDWASRDEAEIGAIMAKLLGREDFGRDDDFFDLGGDSLQAMSLLLELEQRVGLKLPFESFILDGATAASLNARLDLKRNQAETVTVLKQGRDDRVIVLAAIIGGHFSHYIPLIHAENSGYTIVGVHPRGMNGTAPDSTIEALAEHALAELSAANIVPSMLIGFSFGAVTAFEMAIQLNASGKNVPVALIDPCTYWQDPLRRLRQVNWDRRSHGLGVCLVEALRRFRGVASNRIDTAHGDALLNYQPRAAPDLESLLILASKCQWPDSREFWTKLLGEKAEVHVAEGNHRGIMQGAESVALAHFLLLWLNSLDIARCVGKPRIQAV